MESAAETNRKREAIKSAYPGSDWAKKVNLMSVEQIGAIYGRLAANAKLNV